MVQALKSWPRSNWGFRREPKVPYNGAEGVPIREEVIEERPDAVVTRNNYGALCLNVDDVLFVDVDDEDLLRMPVGSTSRAARWALVAALLVASSAWLFPHFNACNEPVAAWPFALKSLLPGFLLSWMVIYWSAHAWHVWRCKRSGMALGLATAAVKEILQHQPNGCWRIYKTPAGGRVMAVHGLFDPTAEQTQDLMKQLRVDPLYAAMCRRQQCFRARVSAKPWRMPNMERMRGPVWPVPPAALARRQAWVEIYNRAAPEFSACHLVEVVGSAPSDPKAQRVQQWHDDLCQAQAQKTLA